MEYLDGMTLKHQIAAQLSEMWAQAYPRDPTPHLSSGGSYGILGQYEKAVAETRKCLSLDPNHAICGSNIMQLYALLNHLDEARATYQVAVSRNPDFESLHAYLYGLAFLQGDTTEMRAQANWAADKPGWSDVLFSYQSDTEAFFGHPQGPGNSLSARCPPSDERTVNFVELPAGNIGLWFA